MSAKKTLPRAKLLSICVKITKNVKILILTRKNNMA